jgi:hypothetical protein
MQLLLLYCLITGFYSTIIFNTAFEQINSSGTEKKGYHHVIASTLFFHTNSLGSKLINQREEIPFPGNLTFKNFNGIIQQLEQQLLSRFINYRYYSNTLLIQLRQQALLYPFHCFT